MNNHKITHKKLEGKEQADHTFYFYLLLNIHII